MIPQLQQTTCACKLLTSAKDHTGAEITFISFKTISSWIKKQSDNCSVNLKLG